MWGGSLKWLYRKELSSHLSDGLAVLYCAGFDGYMVSMLQISTRYMPKWSNLNTLWKPQSLSYKMWHPINNNGTLFFLSNNIKWPPHQFSPQDFRSSISSYLLCFWVTDQFCTAAMISVISLNSQNNVLALEQDCLTPDTVTAVFPHYRLCENCLLESSFAINR